MCVCVILFIIFIFDSAGLSMMCAFFSSCNKQGLLSNVAVHGLSCPMACGDPPRPGMEPVSPSLAGEFFTTEPSGKPLGGDQFSSVQSLTHVRLFATRWTAARQASLSITNSQSLLKLMSIELVMPSNYLILCHLLLLPSSIFPIIRVFSNESVLRIMWPKY